jgi:hypothetical protein
MSIPLKTSYFGNELDLMATVKEFIQQISMSNTNFEITPDDRAVKYYFDFDLGVKPYDDDDDENHDYFFPQPFIDNVIPVLEDEIQTCLYAKYNKMPIIKLAESCGDTADGTKKYSARFFVQNITAFKKTQLEFVHCFNKHLKTNPINEKAGMPILDYICGYVGEAYKSQIKLDPQVYSSGRKMRCLLSNKPNENRPLRPLGDTKIEDTIISANHMHDSHVDAEVPIIQKPTQQSNQMPVIATNETNKYIELMNLIGNKIKRDNWLKLTGWAVNYISKNQYLDFVDIEWKNDAEKLWDEFSNNKRDISIFTIQNIAKDVCQEQYISWLKKYNKLIKIETLEKGESDVASFIAPLLKDKLVYHEKKWYAFNKNSSLWNCDIDPTAIIIRSIQHEINHALVDSTLYINKLADEKDIALIQKKIDSFNKFYRQVSGGGFSKQVEKCLRDDLLDNLFSKKLNIIPYKIPFKNGIFDLKTNKFRVGIMAEDLLTMTIQRDYNPADKTKKQELMNQLKKICNCDDKHLDYYLSALGYAFTGDASKHQKFWSVYGATASNGKSVIFDALYDICPELVVKLKSDLFEKNATNRHKSLGILTNATRIVYANELTSKKQDADFIKNMADGKSDSFDKMYKALHSIDLSKIVELTDETDLSGELACTGNACEIK